MYLSVSKCDVQFRKERCLALIIRDCTAFHDLSVLEEKYRRIFLASVVHDIRTPIQGILGVLDSLDTDLRTREEKEYLSVGRSTCNLLTFLTHDIMDLGQIEAGKFSVNKSAFSPAEAARDCMSSLSFSYRAKGIKLELNLNGEKQFEDEAMRRHSMISTSGVVVVYSDRDRYMQILMNLLGNALKFTSNMGLVRVSIWEDRIKDVLTTSVRDTGIGIRAQDLPNLFQLFGKLQSSASLNPRGVGLGLTICKKLAEALGGEISVDSKFGAGSTFTFTIKEDREDCEFDAEAEGETQMSEVLLRRPGRAFPPIHPWSSRECQQQQLQLRASSPDPRAAKEGPTICECPKMLVVDDNPNNLFVLRGYARNFSIVVDEVRLFYSFSVGIRRGRRHREDRAAGQEQVLSSLCRCSHGSQHAGDGRDAGGESAEGKDQGGEDPGAKRGGADRGRAF